MRSNNYGYLIMILVSISFAPLSAQKWVNLNNRWTTSACCSGGGFGQGSFYTASFFKDSVFMNNHFYYQLYFSEDSMLQILKPTENFYREEKGIVYHLDQYGSPEEIIYNFNLSKQDSIVYNFGLYSKSIIKVISVDTIELMNGEKRKRWSLLDKRSQNSPSNIRHWVEGIGAIEVATFSPRYLFYFDVSGGVVCYFFKEQYLFGVYKGDCPNRLGPRKDPDKTQDIPSLTSFRLLQNTGDGNIRFHLDAPGRYWCQVFDATGRLLQSPLVSQGVNNVSLADAPKGIYILHIYDLENQQQMGLKVVRQ